MATIVAMAPLSSCSSDNDDDNGSGVVDEPKYASVAAQYNITDESAAVKSIELTESGRYLVMMNYSQGNAPKRAEGNTDDTYYGTYTAGDDNATFTLDGFGTMKANDNGSVTITSDKIGGTKTWFAHTAHYADEYKNLPKAYDKLCRTWTSVSARIYTKANGKTIYDFNGNDLAEVYTKLKNFVAKNDMQDDESDGSEFDSQIKWAKNIWPMEYSFTRTGFAIQKTATNDITKIRYKLKTTDSLLTWDDKNGNGVADYDEWYPGLFQSEISGPTKISFKGTFLTIEDINREDGIETGMVIKFKEVR